MSLQFDINVDGVHSGGVKYLWPILGRLIINGKKTKPFVIGVYYGFNKPKSAKIFLQEFVTEYKKLNRYGFLFAGKPYTASLRFIICDNPARAFIKRVIQHNGRYGCDRCFVKGKRLSRRMCFHRYCKLRTNKNSRLRKQVGHHHTQAKTILEQFSIDMIFQFPLDPMHLVHLGVARTLWQLLGDFNRDPDNDFDVDFTRFSAALKELEEWIPTEFSKRRVQSLTNFSDWKATHF
ncbi:hypothetical protein QAD02_014114 [Eretmocerus hayati]|uniref:Uncharacterized protein n=1 Tax=Eretmocerus hayati TaxID=131215 RepID=A0ACC2P783_9HYME|nr:hypothetical protein QAD02_014114 [Eretmocerus hayati]